MSDSIKIAIPLENGQLSEHFSQATHFRLFQVQGDQVLSVAEESSPPHEPGVIPQWMSEQGVDTLIAGCISAQARDIFLSKGVQVVSGAPLLPVEELVQAFVTARLVSTGHVCQCNHH